MRNYDVRWRSGGETTNDLLVQGWDSEKYIFPRFQLEKLKQSFYYENTIKLCFDLSF